MPAPLSGFKLLDLSDGIAGSYAAMLLGDMGAAVVKVEPPASVGHRRAPTGLVFQRGKRSLALDWRTPEGASVARRLAEAVDVLIEDTRPGTMEGRGLGHQALLQANPRLVYCSLPPWGERGPLRDALGSEALVAAYSGLMNGQAPARDGPGLEALPMVSYSTAFLAAFGVSAALYVREQHTGRGQRVQVPLLNGSLALQSSASVWMQGIVRLGQRARTPGGAIPVYRLYRCADDWIFLGCGNPQFWGKLCIALDRLDLMADPRFEGAPWGMKVEDFPALSAELEPMFRTKTAAQWLQFLEDNDIPCAPVQTREEFALDPQVLHSQMMVTLQDSDAGPTRMLGVPVKLQETPGSVGGPAPRVGEHTQQVLAEAGIASQEIAKLRREGVAAQA